MWIVREGRVLSLPTAAVRLELIHLPNRAGLPDVPVHALHHTAATLLLLEGVHAKMVQERLGHSTLAMTMETYSHLIPSTGRAAADKLDALFA